MPNPSDEKPYFGIEVTRRCNLRCPHCFTASSGSAHPGPPKEMLERVIGELRELGIDSIAFSGGEPLIRDDLADLIRHAGAVGIEHVGIVTNGFYADRAKVRELKDAGLEVAQVSVDGVDAADHAALRGCETRDFYRALRAVRACVDAGLVVDLATIVSPQNLRRAPEMAMLAEALGVRGLRYCTFVPAGRGHNPVVAARYAVESSALDRFLEFMRRLNQQVDARLQIFIDHGIGPWQRSGEFRCVAGRSVAYLSAEGDLYPCPSLIFDQFKIGNIQGTSLRALLASAAMSVTRELEKRDIAGKCGRCENIRCSGGCRGAAYARTGSLLGAVDFCHWGDKFNASVHPCSARPTPNTEVPDSNAARPTPNTEVPDSNAARDFV